ncbi:MAG TPA: hypothetical protein VG406_16030 [Isosphaeraceae bacterium]|jgi:photosystem II stability/assembly factor-like uncharacterized protein|nr:hypothetical protein [Isosphaeraceae bacterium]
MILIGTDDGIYRWFEGTPWPVFHGLQGRPVAALASQGGGTLAAADAEGRAWESANNGLDWREVPPPAWAGAATALAMVGTPAMLLLATESSGLYRRALGGDGWTPTANPSARTQGAAPAVRRLDGSTALFAAVAGEGLWRSDDLGGSWSRREGLPDEVLSVHATKTSILLGTADGAWASTDGGTTFQRLGAPEKAPRLSTLEAQPDDPKHLLAGGSSPAKGPEPATSYLFESRDGGKTWTHVFNKGFPEDLEDDAIADIRFNPTNPDYAVVALTSGEMWSTRNGGDWWEPLARQVRGVRAVCAVG